MQLSKRKPDPPCRIGDTIELVAMPDDPDPIPVGTRGVVREVVDLDDFYQLWVDWEIKRSLSPCVPPDTIKVVPHGAR